MTRTILRTIAFVLALCATTSAWAYTDLETTVVGTTFTINNENAQSFNKGSQHVNSPTLTIPVSTELPKGSLVSISAISFGTRDGTPTYPNKIRISVDDENYTSDARASDSSVKFTCRATGATSVKQTYSFAGKGCQLIVGNTYNIALLNDAGNTISGNSSLNMALAEYSGSLFNDTIQYGVQWRPIQEITGTIIRLSPVYKAAPDGTSVSLNSLAWTLDDEPSDFPEDPSSSVLEVTVDDGATLTIDRDISTLMEFRLSGTNAKLLFADAAYFSSDILWNFSGFTGTLTVDTADIQNATIKDWMQSGLKGLTLKADGNNGVTVSWSGDTTFTTHTTFDGGTHSLDVIQSSNNFKPCDNSSNSDPLWRVKNGTILNFKGKDFGGWTGQKWANECVIAVDNGGRLNLKDNGSNTFYCNGRFLLEPGATMDVETMKGNFILRGYADSGYEQIYVPDQDTDTTATPAVISVDGDRNISTSNDGFGIYVGSNAKLDWSAPINRIGGNILKSGAGTLTLKNMAFGNYFTGSEGTIELYADSNVNHSFMSSPFTGVIKVTTQNGAYQQFGHTGTLSSSVFSDRPTLVANGDIRLYKSPSDKPFTVKNLSGSGYFRNENTYDDANVWKYVDTLQTTDTTYDGVFKVSSNDNFVNGSPALTVRGADGGSVHSLTLSGVSDTTGPLTITNNAKVVFSSSGKWSGGTVTVCKDGVLESQNTESIAANLKVEEGATLKFASGVELLASNYDWTSVSTDESVNIDLSAVTPSATPVTLIASGVDIDGSRFTPVNAQEPVALSVDGGALKATFTNNRFVDGVWAVGPESGHDTIVTLSDSATMSIASNMSLGAITVETTTDDRITLTVSGAGALTATSMSLPENVTLKIAKDGEWTVPISGAGAIEIGSGITATINAAVTTSGGFVVGDNATLTVAYANISSSTGAFTGDSTATVKMPLNLRQTPVYQSSNDDYVNIGRFGFGNSSSWQGSVELSGSIGVWPMTLFGNQSSTLVINGLESYIGTYKAPPNAQADWHNVGTLEIASGGWKVTGGYTNGVMVFPASLTGSGLITVSISGGARLFFTGDVSEFAGGIAIKDTAAADYDYGFAAVTAACQVHMIRTSSPTDNPEELANTGYTANAITIAAGNEAKIGSAATWTAPGGLYVRGTLAFDGAGTFSGNATTYSGASLDYSGSTATPSAITGALTFDRDTALIFSDLAVAADYKMAGTLSESVTNTVSLTIGTHAYRAPCGFIATTGKIEFPALATLNEGDSPIAWSNIDWDAKPATINSNTTVVLNVGGNTTLEVNEAVSIHKFIVNGVANAVLTVLADGGSFVASESVAVKGGVLQQGSASVLGATPLIVVEDGATFDMNGLTVNTVTAVGIAGAGAGSWPWALTSSSGAGGAILGGLYLTADATIGGANELKIGQTGSGYYCYLQGFTLTKTGAGAFTCTNMNTPGTGTIDLQGGAMSVNQWNNLNSGNGDTVLILRDGASFSQNSSSHAVSVNTLKFLGGTLTTQNPLYVKSQFVGGGETKKIVFRTGASASLTDDLTLTEALTLDGSMAFNKDEDAASDVVVTVSGTLSSSSAISVGAGVTLNLGTNRPTGEITVAEGGTLAVKQLNATDVIELATSALPASVVLYDAGGEVVSNPRVTYAGGKLTVMLSKPTLEANGTVAFDTEENWINSTMPAASGDAIIEVLANAAEITVADNYTLGNLTITGSGEVSFSGAGSVSAANIYLKNGATLSRNSNISASTGISLDSGTVLKLSGVTESAVISGAGAVETYGDVTMSAANTFTGGITAKSGTLSTTTTSGFGMDKSGSGYSELSLITVEDGACVDLNNTKDHCYALTIAGNGVQLVNGTYSGAVKNTGVAMPDSARQTASLTLTADAMVDVSSGWGLVQNGHNEAYLKLNGHVLTFRGSGTVPMVKVTSANSGTLIFDGATLLLSNYASNFNGVDIIVKGCSSINLTSAPSALGSLTLKPTASGTTASAWNIPAGCVPAVDTSNIDHTGFSDGQVLTLFTAPGGTTLTSSTISAQVNGRYTATISGNTVTATFNAGLPNNYLHYNFDNGGAVDTGKAADSVTQISSVGEATSVTLVDSRNGKAVQVHTDYTPYWDTYANGLSPFHEGKVSVTTAAKIDETNIILWGLGGAAANLAVGLVVTDAHTAKVVARKGTSTVETLATATVTQDLTSGWHFFAIVSDENGTTLYVDHTTASSANGIPTGIGQQGQLGSFHGGAFGASKVGSSGYYLDDWRVYDTKLTAEEVAAIRRALVPVGTIFSVY